VLRRALFGVKALVPHLVIREELSMDSPGVLDGVGKLRLKKIPTPGRRVADEVGDNETEDRSVSLRRLVSSQNPEALLLLRLLLHAGFDKTIDSVPDLFSKYGYFCITEASSSLFVEPLDDAPVRQISCNESCWVW
jgi:hypothetical protein